MQELEELRNDLREIKRKYAVYNKDVFWRYEYRYCEGYQYTHVYCSRCNHVLPRDDPKLMECHLHHGVVTFLEKHEWGFT